MLLMLASVNAQPTLAKSRRRRGQQIAATGGDRELPVRFQEGAVRAVVVGEGLVEPVGLAFEAEHPGLRDLPVVAHVQAGRERAGAVFAHVGGVAELLHALKGVEPKVVPTAPPM